MTTYSDKPWEQPYAATDDMWELQSPFYPEAARVTLAEVKSLAYEPRPGTLSDIVQRRVWLAHNDRRWHPEQ